MTFRLPIPRNWQDFETISLALWKEIWNSPSAQKNGRGGQSQNGVDIFGRKIYDINFSGVQCKDKDGRLGSELTISDVIKECEKAKNFIPKIKHFTIATTAVRDATIQKEVYELSAKANYDFDIDTWSWDDIEDEILYRPSLRDGFYHDLSLPEFQNPSEIVLTRYTAKDRLAAFLSRDSIRNGISRQFSNNITKVAYELADNSYKYGKAESFKIVRARGKFQLIDNGSEFNPVDDLFGVATMEGNIGSFVFSNFRRKYHKEVDVSYKRQANLNVLEISFDEDLFIGKRDEFQEINLDLSSIFSRKVARDIAEQTSLDQNAGEIILNIGLSPYMSATAELIGALIKKLGSDQNLKVYLPRGDIEEAMAMFIRDPRVKFTMR